MPPNPVAHNPAAMSAHAILTCEEVRGVSRITRLRSQGQLVLRPTHAKGFEPWVSSQQDLARVSLSAGTAGPLGGDQLQFDVTVGAGATLVLNEISATLALPGTRGEQSTLTVNVHVDEGGTLIWLPEPVIASRNCDHRQHIRVALADTARFFVREELIIGRHGETPGNIQQHLRVTRDGIPLYDQVLRLGARYEGWNSPSVTAGAKAVGTMLIVDPEVTLGRGRSDLINPETVSVGLDDHTVQITSVAPDSLTLARSLDAALTTVGAPWGAPSTIHNTVKESL